MSELARRNRKRLVDLLGASDLMVLATVPEHVFYCSGYKSMGYDTDRHMRMAVIFDSTHSIVIGPKADLWAAREVMGDGPDYFTYGTFFFGEHDKTRGATEFGTYGEALAAAIVRLAPGKRHLFYDRLPEISALPGTLALQDGSGTFRRSRAIKHSLEIDLMRKVSALTEDALARALAEAKAGMSEAELAAIMSSEIVTRGALPGFIVVTAGERSAFADAYPTAKRLQAQGIVRIDIGCMLDGYWSDTARTAFVGEPRADALLAFAATSAGQEAGRRLVRPGVSTDAIFNAAVAAVRQAGLPDYRRHHVGHGLGIESHEYPTISATNAVTLEPGMVFCIEAPYYRPGWGGVMTEDTLLVTERGAEYFTRLPREPYIIPA
ncbi:M24 family metallopeptidase [Taklimakanibacter deserti]|uniref:M24 family metallopeptidase n=1 Tax=Taklimakanibacter deserti TaxID=2267839 RepID=UPI000E648CA1